MKVFVITTSINDGEYEEHTYVEAESVEEIEHNSVLVNKTIKISFESSIIRIGPE